MFINKVLNNIIILMFCILAIFKNEEEILEEWLLHYINEGCYHFFLIDNGSTDNYKVIINKYNKFITLVTDNTKYEQVLLYNIYFKDVIKQYIWILICDLDEFVYTRKKFKTISSYLNTIDNTINQIIIPWKCFGSNGFNTLDKKEPKSVIQTFTKRMIYDNNNNYNPGIIKINNHNCTLYKCIIRSNKLKQLGIHNHNIIDKKVLYNNNIITDITNQEINNNNYIKCSEEILNSSILHLNHYIIRSLDWFTRIKMTRGSADNIIYTNSRNLDYYHKIDDVANNIVDLELSLKKYNNNIKIITYIKSLT